MIASVVNTASYVVASFMWGYSNPNLGCVAPGSIASVFGTGLATVTTSASAAPLPTTLGKASIQIGHYVPVYNPSNGQGPENVSVEAVPLFYVSPTQINFQVPTTLPSGVAVLVASRDFIGVNTCPAAPGIFGYDWSSQSYRPAAINPDGSVVGVAHPAAPGSTVAVYFTGAGRLTPDLPTNVPPPLDRLLYAGLPAFALIDGQQARIQFVGAAPGWLGLDQVNVVVPGTVGCVECNFTVNIGGRMSASTILRVGR